MLRYFQDGAFVMDRAEVWGPATNVQHQTCDVGRPCTLGPFVGQQLSTDDRVLLAAGPCGTSALSHTNGKLTGRWLEIVW